MVPSHQKLWYLDECGVVGVEWEEDVGEGQAEAGAGEELAEAKLIVPALNQM